MSCPLARQNVWVDKPRYAEAEKQYYERLSKMDGIASLAAGSQETSEMNERIVSLEKSVKHLFTMFIDAGRQIKDLEDKVAELSIDSSAAKAPTPAAAAAAPAKTTSEDDDGVDLFASDEEEDAEAAKIREERLAAYAAKKAKKPVLIAKSSVLLDVKPWDDETDMKAMEKNVRTIEMDGLLWGASKLVPVGYGIQKLQIMCVIEDDKVSIDLLQEKIEEFEDFVQSVDIAAFNKI